jgi:SnoaL-like polyketide cyclase
MSGDDNKRAVAGFVERCQNQHDLDFADEAFHPKFVNHYRPEGQALPETDRPASGFRAFYGALLQGFPDAAVEINEVVGDGVRGIAAHIGARVSALASAGEVLVSSTVRDLSQGRVCNSRTVVPASSRVCRTHGGFSR